MWRIAGAPKHKAPLVVTKGKITPRQQQLLDQRMLEPKIKDAANTIGMNYDYARRLFTKSHIIDAFNKMRAARAERVLPNQDYVLRKAVQYLEANVADFLVTPDDGMPYFDLSQATPEQLACIESLQLDTAAEEGDEDEDGNQRYIDVRKVKLGLPKKKDMLELIGKHVGVGAFKQDGAQVNLVIVKDFTGREREDGDP